MSTLDNLRSYKITGMAAFDWIATAIAVIIAMIIFKSDFTLLNFGKNMGKATLLAIFVHLLFGIPTKLNYYLCLSNDPSAT